MLRHRVEISQPLLAILDALPPLLRRPRIVDQIATAQAAEIVARGARAALARRDLAITPAALAEQLERARSPERLYTALLEAAVSADTLGGPAAETSWFRLVATAPSLRETALRFRNCLAFYIGPVARGDVAIYEVVGEEPACVSLFRSNGHFGLREIAGIDNQPVSRALHAKIVDHLRQHGVFDWRGPNLILAQIAALAGQ